MPYGYWGQVLYVDLSTGRSWLERPDPLFYRRYMGGGCLGAYYLLREMQPGVDPLGPENLLVFAASVVTGAPIPGLAKHAVLAKSPLTGGIGESQAQGYWGAELKRAGFDALVVRGASARPCYLYIHDGEVEIRPAEHLWGREVADAYDRIRAELQEPMARVAVIGPAGERRVRYASIVNDLIHVNYCMGLGAVMGSKGLKAVAVRGTAEVPVADIAACDRLHARFVQGMGESWIMRLQAEEGTAEGVRVKAEDGQLVTRNFRDGYFEHYMAITGATVNARYLQGSSGCFACPGNCYKQMRPIAEPYPVDARYGALEFETAAALGSNLGLADAVAVLKANELCNRLGLDPTSLSGTVAFAMEAVERGLLDHAAFGGHVPTFGDAGAILHLIEQIGLRTGIGDLLAEGAARVARRIGNGVEDLAVTVKQKELPMHDPRAMAMVGLGYAISPIGPDFATLEHDPDFDQNAPEIFLAKALPLGVYSRRAPAALDPDKVRLAWYLQMFWSAFESLNICIYAPGPVRVYTLSELVQAVAAVTGWETNLWELMKLGERRIQLMRVFNLREGFGKADDWLPARMFEPIRTGRRAGAALDPEALRAAIDLYYEMVGWDTEGHVRLAKLHELDIGWAATALTSRVVE